MDTAENRNAEQVIKTNIGPIAFSIYLDASIAVSNTEQHSERHQHAAYELHLNETGAGVVHLDDAEHAFAANSFFVIRPGVYHRIIGTPANPMMRYCFRFAYDIDEKRCAGHSGEEIRTFVYMLANTRFFCSPNSRLIINQFHEICAELSQQKIGYHSRIQHMFSLLLIDVFREIIQSSQPGFSARSPGVDAEDRNSVIERFFDFNYQYKARSGDLCRLINISRSQLNRIIKDKYGMTYKQKHTEAQIEHAKDMLLHTDWSVTRISEEIGYTSVSGFSTFFSHVVGMSPRVFRKTMGSAIKNNAF